MLPQQSTIAPGAEAFLLKGEAIGVLCIHGLGGSGHDFRRTAEMLHAAGWSVSVMRIAGHGMTWREAGDAHLEDWRASVDQALNELRSIASTVIVLGSSFGGALAFDVAFRHPDLVQGIVVVNTPLSYRVGGIFQDIGLRVLRVFSPVFPKPGLSAADKKKYAYSGSLPAWPISLIIESKQFLKTIVRPALPSIKHPLLHIENSNDPYVGVESGSEIDTLYGGPITHIRLSAVTHRPFRDETQTREIVDHVLTFSEQLMHTTK
jgi:carboxylesterase